MDEVVDLTIGVHAVLSNNLDFRLASVEKGNSEVPVVSTVALQQGVLGSWVYTWLYLVILANLGHGHPNF